MKKVENAVVLTPEEYDELKRAAKPKREAKKPIKTSNAVLLILALFLLAFILAMIAIFCVKGAVPDTLIQYTLGAGGVEAVVLAFIKISKVFKEK